MTNGEASHPATRGRRGGSLFGRHLAVFFGEKDRKMPEQKTADECQICKAQLTKDRVTDWEIQHRICVACIWQITEEQTLKIEKKANPGTCFYCSQNLDETTAPKWYQKGIFCFECMLALDTQKWMKPNKEVWLLFEGKFYKARVHSDPYFLLGKWCVYLKDIEGLCYKMVATTIDNVFKDKPSLEGGQNEDDTKSE